MCENVNLSCNCCEVYNKGIFKKTIENSVFTIFVNLIQQNSIVIRYHGKLTDRETLKNCKIIYYFDVKTSIQKEILLTKCTKCEGDNYCATLDLENHTKLFYYFEDELGNVDKNSEKNYELDITTDPIENILVRYGFCENKKLPTKINAEKNKINYIKNWFEKIKYFFSNLVYNNKSN